MLLACCFLLSCSHKAEHVERAFYYWKSGYNYSTEKETQLLRNLEVQKLYVKFFEVEKNDVMGNIPVAKTSFSIYDIDSLSLVPTVYIRNEVFKNCTHGSLDTLADNVNFLINKYCGNYTFSRLKKPLEYQMDCDWTPSTKDNYFYFLKKIKQISEKQISCTLRLYPYKYPDKMGVPPVDKAILMCYNLINPLEDHSRNSIFDIDEFSAYLKTKDDYPLHLDIALPVYSWIQVYQNNHFTKVLYTNTKAIKSILKPDKPLWYNVERDTVINDFYLRRGDKVKVEEVTTETLQKAIEQIKKHVALDKNITVSLFHLDEQQLSRYSNEELKDFYTGFTQ